MAEYADYESSLRKIASAYAPFISHPDLDRLKLEVLPAGFRLSGNKVQKLTSLLLQTPPELISYLVPKLVALAKASAGQALTGAEITGLAQLASATPPPPGARDAARPDTRRVFISHGRNEVVWQRLRRFVVDNLGLQPVVMEEEPGLDHLLLQKFASLASQCCFALVLLTGDDRAEG